MILKKEILIAIFFCFALFFLAVFYFLDHSSDIKNVNIGKCNFKIEIVSDPESQRKGLSNRDFLCENCGMLFNFSESKKYGFWMKDMRFDLDILWLRGNEVRGVKRNISRDLKDAIYPEEEVDRVLELNAGSIDSCEIGVGQKNKVTNYR